MIRSPGSPIHPEEPTAANHGHGHPVNTSVDLQIHPVLPTRRDFRIGILGSGFIVDQCHLVAYRKAGFNPVAIASRTPDHARAVARRHQIQRVHESFEQLLDDPSIEVLDIAVRPTAQAELIKQACQRRTVKAILAQKPLAMNYREALEIVLACEEAGILLAVNQNMRFDQSVRAARTLLERGVLGDPVFATIDMRGIPHWMPWHQELRGLTLRVMSIHHLDAFRYWFGEPASIYCSVRTDPRTSFPHSDGICTYILEYASGLRCVAIDDTWTGPAREGCPADLRIEWRIEGLDGLAIGNLGWCKEPYTTPSTLRYAARGDLDFHHPVWSESWFPDAFIGTMAQLLVALETGTTPAISGKDNLKTLALVDAAYVSAAESRAVSPLQIERNPFSLDSLSQALTHRFSTGTQLPSSLHSSSGVDPGDMHHFTPRAQELLKHARDEARALKHCFVGTEHLLLGIMRLGHGGASRVLLRRGVAPAAVRRAIEQEVSPGPDQVLFTDAPITPRTKRVLALATREAHALSHTTVGTEHILLGLLMDGDGIAARVLRSLGLDPDQTREDTLRELSSGAS
jgi:predicted dehydrogenase